MKIEKHEINTFLGSSSNTNWLRTYEPFSLFWREVGHAWWQPKYVWRQLVQGGTTQSKNFTHTPYLQLQPSQLENSKFCTRVISHVTWWYLAFWDCVPGFQNSRLPPL